MPHKYEKNDTAFIVESNRIIRKVKIRNYAAGLYLVQFEDSTGGIKVRESRLFPSEEEARATLPQPKEKPAPRRSRTPWD